MREPGKLDQRSTTVASLNGHTGSTPLRVAQVVFARYESGVQWNPQPITQGMAVLEMLRYTIPVQRVPRLVMSTLTAMVEGATACTSPRDEAEAVAQSLLRSLESTLTPKPEPFGRMRLWPDETRNGLRSGSATRRDIARETPPFPIRSWAISRSPGRNLRGTVFGGHPNLARRP